MKKLFTMFLFSAFFSFPALAGDGSRSEYASARFIAAEGNVDKKLPTDLGLEITLKEGWYTYWRMAGDNGLPPKFDWTKSENVKHVDILWPAPARFTVADMHSFGYSDNVILPITVTPENPALSSSLDLKLDLVVCHEICVPESVHVTSEDVVVEKDLLKKVKESLPAISDSENLGMSAAVLAKGALVVTAFAKEGFHKDADIIVETSSPLLTAPPQILIDEKNPDQAVLKIMAPAGVDLTKELFGKEATILLLHGGRALEKKFSF